MDLRERKEASLSAFEAFFSLDIRAVIKGFLD